MDLKMLLTLLLTFTSIGYVIASTSASAPSAAHERPTGDYTVDVIVIGAGISGLTAAKNLTEQGYSVAVIEAMDRLGGRSFRITALDDDPDGPIYIDEGGMWAGPTQTLFLDLIKSYNATLYDSAANMGLVKFMYGNTSVSAPGMCWDCVALDKKTADAMKGVAKNVTNKELRDGLLESIRVMEEVQKISDTIDPAQPWLAPNAEILDTTTYEDWLQDSTNNTIAQQINRYGVQIQGATNSETNWTSILHVARQLAAAPQVEVPETWLIKGAAGQFPALLAKDIEAKGGKIFLNAPVRVVEHDDKGVTVVTDDFSVEGKAVIIAMPPHQAGHIAYEPPMPALRNQMVQRTFMASVIKAVAVYETPFWNVSSNGDWNFTTYAIAPYLPGSQGGFDISPPESIGGGGVGVLGGFIMKDAQDNFTATTEQLKEVVLPSWAKMYGEEALKPIDFVYKIWAEEPFIGGAYSAVMMPGFWTQYGEALTAPVGTIYWAGTEHSPRWPGFYEGAIQAGVNAVAHVKADVEPTGKYGQSDEKKNAASPSSSTPTPSSAGVKSIVWKLSSAVVVVILAAMH